MLATIRVKMRDSEKKSEQEHVRHFLYKTCNQDVSGSFTLQPCKKTAKKCTKKMCYFFFCYFFPNKTDCSFFDRSCCLLRLALHDFIFCSGKLSILQRASLLALATSIYYTVTITIGTFSTDGFDDGYGELDRPAGTSDTRRRQHKSPRK